MPASPKAFGGYIWSPYSRAYLPLVGSPVDTSEVRQIVSEVRSGAANRLAKLAQDVLEGRTTNLTEFALQFKLELKNLYTVVHVTARGGIENMTESEWGQLGASLKEQYGYADNFVRDIELERGRMAIVPRINLYVDSAWGARGEFENVVRDRELKLGSLERRVLGDADHCDECVELAERDWQPPSLMPDIGDTECGLGCACHFEFENTELDALNQAFGRDIRPEYPASGHTQIGVEGDEPTDDRQFTLYPDMEKSLKGGAGSGNFGHSGRPGERGGSGDGDRSTDRHSTSLKLREGFTYQTPIAPAPSPRSYITRASVKNMHPESKEQMLKTLDRLVKTYGEPEGGLQIGTMAGGNSVGVATTGRRYPVSLEEAKTLHASGERIIDLSNAPKSAILYHQTKEGASISFQTNGPRGGKGYFGGPPEKFGKYLNRYSTSLETGRGRLDDVVTHEFGHVMSYRAGWGIKEMQSMAADKEIARLVGGMYGYSNHAELLAEAFKYHDAGFSNPKVDKFLEDNIWSRLKKK